MDAVLIVVLLLLIMLSWALFSSNLKLEKELKEVKKTLKKKTKKRNVDLPEPETAVMSKEETEHSFSAEEVMEMVNQGISKEEISEMLSVPVSKIELVIKFDKIKKVQQI